MIVIDNPLLKHQLVCSELLHELVMWSRAEADRGLKPAAPHFDVALELARGDTLTSPLLPGFALTLDAVFGE